MKKTLFFGLHFLLLFLISSCGIDITVVPKIIPGASNVFSPGTVQAPAYTNSFSVSLTYGNSSIDYDEYCILENDTDELNCSWTSGVLPSTFIVSSTDGVKRLSVWIRKTNTTSTRVDSNAIVLDTTSPDLSLTSLDGGGALVGGNVVAMTWIGSDLNPGTQPMRIEYSSDNGSTWNLIADLQVNTGSYNWTLPSITTLLNYIRITMTDLAGNATTRVSQLPFSINSTTPSILVLSPNGGEIYAGGSAQNITWSTSGLPSGASTIALHYTTDDSTFNSIATGEANDGTYVWTVPNLDSATVKVRVTVTDSFSVETSDQSNANFEIDSTHPLAPTALALQNPSTTPSQFNNPIIRVSGVNFGHTVTLYADPTCSTPTLRGTTVSAGVTADVTSSGVGSDTTITFYATQTDLAGNESVCSTAFVDYERDTTAPILASATVTNSSPTATVTFNLTYGAVTGTYTHYCIRENSTAVAGCTWITGALPSAYNVTAVDEAKVLSIWLRDFAGNVSTRVNTNSVNLVMGGNAPVASNLIPASFDEDTEEIITLVYNDADGDFATTCSVSSLVNVTETTACSCTLGTCTVGVTGTLNYSGAASFNYTVTSSGQVSNSASSTITIDPVDDAPILTAIADQNLVINTASGALAFVIDDVDSVVACSDVTASSSVTTLVVNPSLVIGGTSPNCTLTITPENNQTGATVITMTITKNALSSQSTFNVFVSGIGWSQEAYIKAANNSSEDLFGSQVSLSADTLAVSATIESSNQTIITNGITASSDNSNFGSGAVYVYKRTGVSWVQEAYIKAANNDSSDIFGHSLSLSGDTLVVGAHQEDSNQTTITNGATASSNNTNTQSGAVYVYKRTGVNWSQEAYIKAVNNNVGDFFGISVSLSGNTLAVGAIGEASNQTTITNGTTASSNNSNLFGGATYIYQRTGVNWAQQAFIKSANNEIGDYFGDDVSLGGDTLVVGSPFEDSNQSIITNGTTASNNNSNSNSGAVYVYKRTVSSWAQEAYIKAANNNADDRFGYSVSINGDTIAVGAYQEDSNQNTITNGVTASSDNSHANSGAVYVYKRTGVSWAQEAYIKAVNNDVEDRFGVVSLSGDTLVVSAAGEASNQTTITNGATASNNNSNTNSGAVYVYKRTGVSWAQEAYIKAVNNDAEDRFAAVSLSGDTIAVGANGERSNQITITNGTTASSNNSNSNSGAVYIYRNNNRLFDPSEFIASNRTSNSITLSWSTAGLKATGYKIAYSLGLTPPANCSSGIVVDVGNVLTTTITGLLSSAFYSFRICSYDASLVDNQGYTSMFQTQSATPEISNLTLNPSLNSMTLNWTSGGGLTTGFVIAFQSGSAAPPNCSSGTTVDVGNVTSYEVMGLTDSTTYAFRVCSYDSLMTNSFGVTGTERTHDIGWNQEAYIKLANNDANDQLGYFNVSTSLSGDTLALAAWLEDSNQTTITNGTTASANNSNTDSGAVYVYKRSGVSWAQEAYIKAVNNNAGDYFGMSVSLNKDTLVVGAHFEDSIQTIITNGATASTNNTSSNSGAVYVYKRTGVNWAQEAYIKAANNGSEDLFGAHVSLSGDTLAVGAYVEDSNQTTITNGATASSNNSNGSSGAVYVFKRNGVAWAQEAYIKAANNDVEDFFGYSVSLSGDTLAVGAYQEDSNQNTITNGVTASSDNSNANSGAVYVYKRTGVSWAQEAYLKAANTGANDNYGLSVSLSGDNLAVGSYNEDSNQTTITNGATASSDNSNANSGAVYLYKRSGTSWAQEAYLKSSNNNSNDLFGRSINLSGDTLVVGAYQEDSNQTTITNGATSSNDNSNADSGAVYVYKRTGVTWAQEAYIKAVNNDAGDLFGSSVGLSGDTLVVGAYQEDSNQTTITNGITASSNNSNSNSGAVYIYRNNARLFDPYEFIAFNRTTSSITLTWSTAGLKAVGYKVAYNLGSTPPVDCSSGTVVDVGNVLTTTIAGLTHSTLYSFRICSYDVSNNLSQGVTSTFASSSFSPEVLSFQVIPTKFTATLNWLSGGGATTGFRIAYQAGTTAPGNCASGTVVDVGNVSTYQLTGLIHDTDYSFRICSYDVGNNNSVGMTTNATTLDGWEQEAYIKAANNNSGDIFGSKVSLSGHTLAVSSINESSNQNTITNGATASSNNSNQWSGAVYIYTRSGALWSQQAYIKAVNNNAVDYFGTGLSLSGDTLAVGSMNEASNQTIITNGATASGNNSNGGSGAVYVYKRTGTNWAQEAYIKAVNNNASDNFGSNVYLSGYSLAVSSPREDSNETIITNGTTAIGDNSNTDSGAVYIYSRTGTSWAQEAYIKAANNDYADEFGSSLSLDGDTLAVGSRKESSEQLTITNGKTASLNNASVDSGAVYIYKRIGLSWIQEAYVKALNNNANDWFGISVSLSGDTLVVGATGEDSNQITITNGATASSNNSSRDSGAVYVYKRSGVFWSQEAYIKAANSDSDDWFGASVSTSGDTLIVGATGEDSNQITITNGATASSNNSNAASGAVYMYKRTGTSWIQEAYIKAANNDSADGFGNNVSLSGDTFAVGAPSENSNQTTITNGITASSNNSSFISGAVYVYRNSTTLYDPAEFTLTAKTLTSLTLSWSSAGATAAGYRLAYASGLIAPGNCSSGTVVDVGNVLTTTLSSLSPSTYYSFRICAYDASSNLRQGYTATFHTDQYSPEILTISSTEFKRSVTLNWTSGGGSTTNFIIAYQTSGPVNPNCSSGTTITLGNVSTYNLTSLTPDTDYYFRICSRDGNGVNSLGIPHQARTLNLGWEQQAYIKAVNSDENDQFGNRIFLNGDTLVVSSYGEDSDQTTITNGLTASSNNSKIDSGAVYVYKRAGATWAQEAYIKAVNSDTEDNFGSSISLSGETLAIGANSEDSNQTTITNGATASNDNSNLSSGAVYVYKRTGATWAQEAYLKATNNEAGDFFGGSVSLSGDTLAVGASGESSNQTTITNGVTASSDNSNANSGAVYVYKRTGITWAQEAYIKAINGEAYVNDGSNNKSDNFGSLILISGDTLIVSAVGEDSDQTTITNGLTASSNNSKIDSGAVYVYKRTGATWAQEAYIKAVNSDISDNFGSSISLSGGTLVVGVYQEESNQTTITNGATASNDNSNLSSGAVYVYKRTGATWAQEAYLKATNNEAGDFFGGSVSLSGDTLAVGASGESSNQTTITNGVTASSDNSNANSGAVYVYKRTGATWAQEAYIKAVNSDILDFFGSSISLSGDTLAVSAVGEDSNQTTITNGATASSNNTNTQSGAVYVYINPDRLFDPSDLFYSNQTLNSITLNWSSAGSFAAGYRIAYAVGLMPPANCSSGTDVGNVLTYNVSGLTEATQYSFRICSYDSSNNLSEGVVYTFQTESRTPEVLSLDITTDSNSATLSWTYSNPFTVANGGFVISYQLGSAPANCSLGTTVTIPDENATTYQVTGLNSGATYGFRICSYVVANPTPSVGITQLATTTSSGQGWSQEAYIKAFNADAGDEFGGSVSLSGDFLAVGAIREDNASQSILISSNPQASHGNDNSARNSGAVYIYSRTGDTWSPQAYIKSVNSENDDYFGYQVSLVGNQLAVSAIGESSNETTITNGATASSNNSSRYSGAVYLYSWDGTTWNQEAYIKPSNTDQDDFFGENIAFDGKTLLVGVPNEDSNETTILSGGSASLDNSITDSGAIYVYYYKGGWIEQAYIKAVNARTLYELGSSVSISGDTIAVGSIGEASKQTIITDGRSVSTDNSNPSSGATYIYQRGNNNSWELQAYIKAFNTDRDDYFGESVSLSGNLLAIGASGEDSNQTTITNAPTTDTNNNRSSSGAVYIYLRQNRVWSGEAYIKVDNAERDDWLGKRLSLSGDTLIVAATGEDSNQTTITNGAIASSNNSSLESGAVYVFKRVGTSWSQTAYIKPPVINGTMFGSDLEINGDTIVVGSSGEGSNQTTITNGTTASSDISAPDSGAVYVFRNSSTLFDPTKIRVERPDSQSLSFIWDSAGAQAASYAVAISQGGSAPSDCTSGDFYDVSGTTSYTFSGLSPDTEYSVRICSVNAALQMSQGFILTLKTAE